MREGEHYEFKIPGKRLRADARKLERGRRTLKRRTRVTHTAAERIPPAVQKSRSLLDRLLTLFRRLLGR